MTDVASRPQPTVDKAIVSRRIVITALATLPALAVTARAQSTFPERPIRLVVPYGAGTGTDSLARRLAAAMPGLLGQSMIVENRAGANGFIGAEAVARSAPDGYTLILATDHVMCYNPALFQSLPYNPIGDFTAVAGLTSHPHLLVVPSSLPVNSLADLVALAKSQPGSLSFGTTGVGTATHLVGAIFQKEAGIELTHVPYPGGTQLFADLLAGRVSMMFYPYQLLRPYLESGRLRALANATEQRADWLPDLPTMTELGYPGSVMAAWLAIYAPAGTPNDRIARIADALRKALDNPEVGGALPPLGIDIRYRPPAELAAFTKAEISRCRAVVQMSGARVE